MREAGLRVVAPVPDYGYLVWGSSAALETAKARAPVRWSGTYQPEFAIHPALTQNTPSADVEVLVQVYAYPGARSTVDAIRAAGKALVRPPTRIHDYHTIGIVIASDRLAWLAGLPGVVNVEPAPTFERLDEVQGQIVAGAVISNGTGPSGPGYLEWLTGTVGMPTAPTAYPIVDVTDDGIDDGSDTPQHPDFYEFGDTTNADRLVYNYNWTSDPAADGQAGHGNINASIVAGYNDKTGFPYEDSDGYNYGLGINPFGRVAGSKVFNNEGAWEASGTYTDIVSNSYAQGARISSNSWGCTSCSGDYRIDDHIYDVLVRDAQPAIDGNQAMHILFAAGNSGPSANTTGTPANAKNVITVGAAENVRTEATDGCGISSTGADNANDIASFSSRGPTDDGRAKPDLVAPGTHVMGAASQDAEYDGTGVCGPKHFPSGQTLYTWSSGTSHSTPAGAGAASLLYRYYQDHFGGAPPSPAMLKAYLINSARYLNGTGAGGDLPSNDQGFGEINLGMAFDGAPRIVVDQDEVFTESGAVYEVKGSIADSDRPFRVTLAWTDAPGTPFAAAYVNNLDLEVTVGGQIYRGNVFSGATSITGGSADPRNNVESVFLPAGEGGTFAVRVVATNVAGDGLPGNADETDQDFALVVYNSQQDIGYLHGTVTDSNTDTPLAGGIVAAITGSHAYTTTTALDGSYHLELPPDTYTVAAWKYGYSYESDGSIDITNSATTTHDLALTPTIPYSLTGRITDTLTAEPLPAAVAVYGPFSTLVTETTSLSTSGRYSLTLFAGTYTVTAKAPLHEPATDTITLPDTTVLDFGLVPTTTDGLLWGQIANANTGVPVPGAAILITPGLTETVSDNQGAYELLLSSGTAYTVTVSAPLYSSVTDTQVSVPQSNRLQRDYALPASRLALTPSDGLHTSLVVSQYVTSSVTISNAGTDALTFSIVEEDTGTPSHAGPDTFGYRMWDSINAQGAVYEWIDTPDATPLSLDDDGEATVTLPFAFDFYSSTSTVLRIGENGGVLFGATSEELGYSNESLETAGVNDLIVPFWDDLDAISGTISYQTLGSEPDRRFVITWADRPHWKSAGSVGAVTFQLILYERTNNLKFQYRDVVFGDSDNPNWDYGGSATIGLRNDDSAFLEYGYNTQVLHDELALCFQYPGAPPCDPVDVAWLTPANSAGTVPASTDASLPLTIDASGFADDGTHYGSLWFYSNDPDSQPYTRYPISLTVTSSPRLTLQKTVSASRVEAETIFSYTITVTNTGGPATEIRISDTLPLSTTFVHADQAGTLAGNDVVWDVEALKTSEANVVRVAVSAPCVPTGTHLVNDTYQVTASEHPTPVVGAPVTTTVTTDGATAGFSVSTPVLRDRPATFTNQSLNATGYLWEFGDGATSTDVHPRHTFTTPGPHTVRLEAQNDCTSSDEYTQTITVYDQSVWFPIVETAK